MLRDVEVASSNLVTPIFCLYTGILENRGIPVFFFFNLVTIFSII